MKTKLLVGFALAGLALVPASAFAQAMSVATFLAKADALEKKGMLALMSSDVGLLKAEVQNSSKLYRAQIDGDKAAKRPAHSCPPPKGTVKMSSDELIAYYRSIPVAQRAATSTKAGFYGLMKKRYPCPS